MSGKRKNYDVLDLTKFILCLMVVAIHTELFPIALYPWLRLAVPLFFMISSFLLFGKVKETRTVRERNRVIKHYVIRIWQLYLFWFVVLLPVTIYVRRNWFDNGPIIGLVNVVLKPLLGSTFPASWYLMASIFGTLIVNRLSLKFGNIRQFILFSLAYLICCFFSSYMPLFGGSESLGFIDHLFSPQFSFLSGLIFIWLGKTLAENKLKLKKKTGLTLMIISGILLWVEWFTIYKATGNLNNDCYIMLVPTALLILYYVKDIKMNIKNSKTLRQFSNFTYPPHASVAMFVGAGFRILIKNGAWVGVLNFVITLGICAGAFAIVKKLENKIPLLKLSY